MKSIRLFALAVAVIGLGGFSSCNTSRGFGQDLQKVGGNITQTAEETGGTGTR
jgi:predicted small secreted protein